MVNSTVYMFFSYRLATFSCVVVLRNRLKDNVMKMIKTAMDWENIHAKDTSDKGLLSKIHTLKTPQ